MTSPLVTGGYLALKSKLNSKYVRYMPEHTEGKVLQVSGLDAVSPYTRFQAEPSKKHEGHVHLKCCYNSKYWVAREVNGVWCLFGDANEPEEDLSKPSCMLFRRGSTTNDSDDSYTELIQAKLMGHVYMVSDDSDPTTTLLGCLLLQDVQSSDKDPYMFSVIDLDKQMVLPKHICFKGDNDMYGRIFDDHQYVQFSSNDIGDPQVRHTIHTNEDGTIRIKSDGTDRFWRRDQNWIKADSNDNTSNDPNTLFRAVKLDDADLFALQNVGNNNYCKRLSYNNKDNCLNASLPTITKEALLRLEEAVLSRKIYGVEYHVKDAKIHGSKVLTMATAQAVNRASTENTATLTLNFSVTRQRKWESSISLKLGVTTTIKAGVPSVARAEVELQTELTGSYTWGKSDTRTEEHSVEYALAVPAMTKLNLNVLATQGMCDVPFSYLQEDVLTDGEKVIRKFDDGIYRGVNSYNFTYQVKEEKLI